MSYTAFGEAAGNVAGADGKKAPEVTHRFAGEQLDPTSLYFNRARYYHPALGRFMSLDPLVGNPLDPTSYNRYMYARNNPALLTDPSGQTTSTPTRNEHDANGGASLSSGTNGSTGGGTQGDLAGGGISAGAIILTTLIMAREVENITLEAWDFFFGDKSWQVEGRSDGTWATTVSNALITDPNEKQ